jgi:hypothetical protein
MKAQLIGFLAIASASTLSSPTSSDLADDNSETSDHQGMEQKRRRLGLSRQEARAAKVEDIMWSGSPSADGVHSTAPPPNAGPVEGVSYWYESLSHTLTKHKVRTAAIDGMFTSVDLYSGT